MVTIIVILVMVMHFRSSILISGLLPIAVLMTFIAMKQFGVEANIVALSGIAIAIGTMVDLGIVISENIIRHLDEADPDENKLEVIYRATCEVGSAVLTAVATTVVSFLPVFTMEAAEGKLFKPLAYTKTFALVASVIVALTIIPPFAQILFTGKIKGQKIRLLLNAILILFGLYFMFSLTWWVGLLLILVGAYHFVEPFIPQKHKNRMPWITIGISILVVVLLLAGDWLPLGPEKGMPLNLIFVSVLIGGMLLFFQVFRKYYQGMLEWALDHKAAFLSIPGFILLFGMMVWLGFDTFFGWLPRPIRNFKPVAAVAHTFPGLGKEFMPPLDEGSYLFMPSIMPHASIGEALDILRKQDMAFSNIPEVSSAVGKLGRVESPLDPAPISMIETVINYHSKYLSDDKGEGLRFKFNSDSNDYFRSIDGEPVLAQDGESYRVKGTFIRDENNRLIPDSDGRLFRLWRPALDPDLNQDRKPWPGINSSQDIWDEILVAGEIPGATSAPKLQPIATRIVMLQSGMRAPMGIKVKGPDLETLDKVGLDIEKFLKEVPSVEANMVFADRIVGKPYLEIEIDRLAIARYGIKLNKVMEVIEVAIGGKQITTTVEGRERYPVRIRYLRELRDNIESLGKILVPAPNGTQIPIIQLAKINYVRGPQVIKSEDTFLVGYVIFDKKPEYAEVDVVEMAQAYLLDKIDSGEFVLPAGVSYRFTGSYENQIRAQKRLSMILPLALFVIFMILYFQFKSVSTTFLVFSGIVVAWAGGFIMIWLYGQPWFLNIDILGVNLQELFKIRPINLSVAVWVGFLALFGIASDNGVIIATYLRQIFDQNKPKTVAAVREATILAGMKRVRPALMTTATTVLALIPVLSATGRGADIMVPMAIPSFGGMVFALVTMFIVPVLYSAIEEWRLKFAKNSVELKPSNR